MSKLDALIVTVEKGIESLKIDPKACRGQKPGQWDFVRGSANIAVGVIESERFPNGYFYVSSVLLDMNTVPKEKNEELFRTLLETNATLCGMALAYGRDVIYIVSNRDAEGLDPQEVANAIADLSYYADTFDDQLKAKFTSTTPTSTWK